MIYKGEHPINWCPRCETAIADAEVEHDHKQGMIYTIPFMTDSGEVLIATTRPIYLPACVALSVHPEDKRYNAFDRWEGEGACIGADGSNHR